MVSPGKGKSWLEFRSLTSRRSQPSLALLVPLSRFTPRVGGGSAFFVRMKKHFLVGIVALLCGLAAGAFIQQQFSRARLVAEWSAMKALSAHIAVALDEYKKAHGDFPDSLDALQISYEDADGATPAMLQRFCYHRRGDSYDLDWDESVFWGRDLRQRR